MSKTRSKRIDSRKIYDNDIVYMPQEIIDNLTCSLSLQEMERCCNLSCEEWEVLEKVSLSKREKQCMYMTYWEHMTQVQIAKDLDILQSTVSRYLKRARIKIKKYFKKEMK